MVVSLAKTPDFSLDQFIFNPGSVSRLIQVRNPFLLWDGYHSSSVGKGNTLLALNNPSQSLGIHKVGVKRGLDLLGSAAGFTFDDQMSAVYYAGIDGLSFIGAVFPGYEDVEDIEFEITDGQSSCSDPRSQIEYAYGTDFWRTKFLHDRYYEVIAENWQEHLIVNK